MPEEIANLDNCGVMIFFKELSHNHSHPITTFTNNNLTFFHVFGPRSPLAFNFVFNIVDEDFSSGHRIGIIIDFVTNTNNRAVISQPCYFLDMISFDVIGLFVGETELNFELLD